MVDNNSFKIKIPVSEANQWLKNYIRFGIKELSISGIKAEYPSQTRFDIAFIDPVKIISENVTNHYTQACLFAIELKLGFNDNWNSNFKSDIIKLLDYQKINRPFTGLALNFEQNPIYEKKSILHDYHNLNMLEVDKILVVENTINYYFIAKDYILGGKYI